jgi:hypothetical protein
MEDQRGIWPVRMICDALSVSASGYYARRSRPESARKIANREPAGSTQRVHAHRHERYGAPPSVPSCAPRAKDNARSAAFAAHEALTSPLQEWKRASR